MIHLEIGILKTFNHLLITILQDVEIVDGLEDKLETN